MCVSIGKLQRASCSGPFSISKSIYGLLIVVVVVLIWYRQKYEQFTQYMEICFRLACFIIISIFIQFLTSFPLGPIYLFSDWTNMMLFTRTLVAVACSFVTIATHFLFISTSLIELLLIRNISLNHIKHSIIFLKRFGKFILFFFLSVKYNLHF